jgi:hypothetical protein
MYPRILLFAFYRENGYQMSVFRKMNMFTLCVAKGFMFITVHTVNRVPVRYHTHRGIVEFVFSVIFLSQNKRIPLLGLGG